MLACVMLQVQISEAARTDEDEIPTVRPAQWRAPFHVESCFPVSMHSAKICWVFCQDTYSSMPLCLLLVFLERFVETPSAGPKEVKRDKAG